MPLICDLLPGLWSHQEDENGKGREREKKSGGQMDMTAKKDSVSQSDSAQISLGCTVLLRGESNREIITTITTTINNNKSLSTSWVIDCAKRQGRKGNERGLGRQVDADKTLNTTWQAISGRPLLSIEVLYRFPRVEQKAKCTKWWWWLLQKQQQYFCRFVPSLLLSFACRFKSEKTYTKERRKQTYTHTLSPSISEEEEKVQQCLRSLARAVHTLAHFTISIGVSAPPENNRAPRRRQMQSSYVFKWKRAKKA